MEYGPRFGISGKIVESEVFGESKEPMQERGHEAYVPYNAAFREVKNVQDSPETKIDPTDPDKEFANDLHATIAEEYSPEDYSKLRFYTAIGTALDRFYGIDGFFELDLENGNKVSVTMDVTTNPHKIDYKADVIIHIPSDGVDRKADAEEYRSVLEGAAQLVIEEIGRKLGKREVEYAA